MKLKVISRKTQLLLVAISATLAFLPGVGAQQQGGRLLTAQEVKQLPARAKRYALVVGVDEYQDSQISRLSGATNDAKSLADALVRYAGFPADQVILLASDQPQERQPNRGNILQYLSNLRGVVPEDGLLLVSFAGHGIERGGRGFLCPTDARIGGSIELLESTAVAVDTVREWIRGTGVKQVLIVLDACRNDPTGRGESENKLTDSFARKFNFDVVNKEITAFATLYATDVGHVAYEYKEKKQGYFTYLLVEGLKGAAANERGEVTLGGLVRYLQEQVPKRIRLDLGQEKSQKPYATVGGYKADELVISITVNATTAAGKPGLPSVDPAALELEFWNSIKASADPEDFRAYLEKYPSGTFTTLARNKIRNFEAAAKSSAPTSNPPTSNPAAPPSTSSGAGKQENVDPQTITETVNGVAIEMVRVPSGKFTMGSPASEAGREDNEGPQHEVSVSSFYMGKYEVTQAQWRAVANLPIVQIELDPDVSKYKGDNLPVEQVYWSEAIEFCERLSRVTGKPYRLPTEAEWEYACRAMTTGPYAGTLDLMGWYDRNSGGTTHQVGTKQANRFGLYDMHGNVFEYCQDWYGKDYYLKSPSADPMGPGTGSDKVWRGGCYLDGPLGLRSALRFSATPPRVSYIGFRIVRTFN